MDRFNMLYDIHEGGGGLGNGPEDEARFKGETAD